MSGLPAISRRKEWTLLLVRILLWIPAVLISLLALTGNLTANPVQAAIQRSGQVALVLIALSLSISPVIAIAHWTFLSPLRKILGLCAFYYAAGHFLLFILLDNGLDLGLFIGSIPGKPYILAGLSALLILFLLAVTSNRWSKQHLGKNWKRLQRLVYLAAPLAGLHFAWALKGDLFRLSGNIFWPLFYLVIISLLFLLRIPWIKRRWNR